MKCFLEFYESFWQFCETQEGIMGMLSLYLVGQSVGGNLGLSTASEVGTVGVWRIGELVVGV